MPDADRNEAADDVPEESRGLAAMWPFLLAAVIVILLVGFLVIRNLVTPMDSRLSPEDKVIRAVNSYYTARNGADYGAFRAASCESDLASASFPTQSAFEAQTRESQKTNGKMLIDTISSTNITGSTATTTIHWNFEKSKNDKHTAQVRLEAAGNDWKVCGVS